MQQMTQKRTCISLQVKAVMGLACVALAIYSVVPYSSSPSSRLHPRLLDAQAVQQWCSSTGTCHPVLLTPAGAAAKRAASLPDAKLALFTRECGSPAKEGYARLVYSHLPASSCISQSMTLLWYQGNRERGGQLSPRLEQGALYDGLPVSWGHINKKKTVQECAEQCARYTPGLEPLWTGLPCNAFAFCPEDGGCWAPEQPRPDLSPKGACWLMFTEAPASPEVIMRSVLEPKANQAEHLGAPGASTRCTWQTGVLLPEDVALSNGSWSPKHWW